MSKNSLSYPPPRMSPAGVKSLEDVHSSVPIPAGKPWRRMFAFAGPAYLVSVGYMDPGNWATDLAGGAKFGYALIWVLLMSNLMAVLLQTLSARLGLVTGRDLAQACATRTTPSSAGSCFSSARSPSPPATWPRCSARRSASTCSRRSSGCSADKVSRSSGPSS